MAKKRRSLPADLAAGVRRVQRWRDSRTRLGRMPEELWSECVALASSHGVNPVARALRLDYYSLKRRLEGSATRPKRPRPTPLFVEVDVPPPSGGAPWVIELQESRGRQMSLRVPGPVDVVALVEAFWRRRRCSR